VSEWVCVSVCVSVCLSVSVSVLCLCLCLLSVFVYVSVLCLCLCMCLVATPYTEASHWKSSNCISNSFFRSTCGWHVVDAVCDVLAVTAILSVN
jgi:hypothetical protein